MQVNNITKTILKLGKRKKKDMPLLEKVEITGVAAEGKALARVNDKVLFVPYAAPGDILDIQVKKSKRNFMEGVIDKVHKLSDDRAEPFCKHFGLCGGCRWQHLPYDKQLYYKQQQVLDSFTRIGKVDLAEVSVLPIAASPETRFYRNKLEFTFSNRRWLSRELIDSGVVIKEMDALGFHVPGLYDKVLDVEKCWLQPEPSNAIRLAVKEYAVAHKLDFFDLRKHAGFLRNLIIRTSLSGELMVVMVFGHDDSDAIHKLMSHIDACFPDVTTLAYFINAKGNPGVADLEPVIFKGREFIMETMDDLHFQIGPKSFFQTNAEQAHKLYRIAREFAGLTGPETVYDLYTGTGSIACFVARDAARVIGIEYIDEAVEYARINADRNGIKNTLFFAGDMAAVFNREMLDKHGNPHVIITDPPRAGMHPRVVKQIVAAGADRIVYVSCNPATQARDIEMLSDRYRVEKMQAVDMFPHTQHVENVVLLVRGNQP